MSELVFLITVLFWSVLFYW